MNSSLSEDQMAEARGALLRVLDELDTAALDLGGPPQRVDLIVAYSIGRPEGDEWHEVGGWKSTTGPAWGHAALLRRALDALDT